MHELKVQFEKKLKNFDLKMDFDLDRGCLGILGASGCGKSMTLKAIAGIVTPESGRITSGEKILFDKERRVNLPPQKRKVGYLFQNYALFPNMTVAQNIAAGFHGSKEERQQAVADMVERFQLNGLENQFPYKLSGGQQQRTALARILVSEPDILLLDEPFSAMDSYMKEELQLELGQHLKEFQGCTVIVSHDRDEIYRLCDKTMIMGEGQNLICDDTKALFENPRHMMAARLTGCKNISRAKQTGRRKVMALEWGIELTVAGDIPENLAYIGIRAHDFIPVSESAAGEEIRISKIGSERNINLIQVAALEKSHAPFEWTVLFQNSENPKGSMWMKMDREKKEIPKWVRVNPEKILLLEE